MSKLYHCINIIFTNLLLVKPELRKISAQRHLKMRGMISFSHEQKKSSKTIQRKRPLTVALKSKIEEVFERYMEELFQGDGGSVVTSSEIWSRKETLHEDKVEQVKQAITEVIINIKSINYTKLHSLTRKYLFKTLFFIMIKPYLIY